MTTAVRIFGVLALLTGVAAADDISTAMAFTSHLQAKRTEQLAAMLDAKIDATGPCTGKAIAKCLVDLEPTSTTTHFAKGTAAILFRGGIALSITAKDGKIVRIGYVDTDKTDAAIPTVFRLANAVSAKLAPTSAITTEIDDKVEHRAIAVVKTCLDAAGKQKSTRVVATSGIADFDALAKKTVTDFAFAAVELDGKPHAVCEVVKFDLDTQPNAAPAVSMRPQNVAPMILEELRIAGEKTITPDDKTKTEITRSGKEKVIGSFKLCLDDQGASSTTTVLKSTGFAAYDAKIIREMKKWRYKPFLVNGVAVPVCTAVTFIYTQKVAPPPTSRRP